MLLTTMRSGRSTWEVEIEGVRELSWLVGMLEFKRHLLGFAVHLQAYLLILVHAITNSAYVSRSIDVDENFIELSADFGL